MSIAASESESESEYAAGGFRIPMQDSGSSIEKPKMEKEEVGANRNEALSAAADSRDEADGEEVLVPVFTVSREGG